MLGGLWGWYAFLAPAGTLALERSSDGVTLLLYVGAAAVILAVIHALDTSARQLQEERDRSTILFQELQHRVANNMAMIAALLRLQKLALPERGGPAAAALDEAQSRVDMVGRIHRRLHDPATSAMPVGEALQALCRDILAASGASRVACTVNAPPAVLPASQLLPISLIVAEAVTNALKHAFADGRGGRLAVDLVRSGDAWVLTVVDDGGGRVPPSEERLPADSKAGGLGTRIVQTFARQLRGEAVLRTDDTGTTLRLTFPA